MTVVDHQRRDVFRKIAESGSWAARAALATHPDAADTVCWWPQHAADGGGIHPDAVAAVDAAVAAGNTTLAALYYTLWVCDSTDRAGSTQAATWLLDHYDDLPTNLQQQAVNEISRSRRVAPEQIAAAYRIDPDETARLVAANEATPPDLLAALLSSPDDGETAAANPSTSVAAITHAVAAGTLTTEALDVVATRCDVPAPLRAAAVDQIIDRLTPPDPGADFSFWHPAAFDPSLCVLTADQVTRALDALGVNATTDPGATFRCDVWSTLGVLLLQPHATPTDRARILAATPPPSAPTTSTTSTRSSALASPFSMTTPRCGWSRSCPSTRKPLPRS